MPSPSPCSRLVPDQHESRDSDHTNSENSGHHLRSPLELQELNTPASTSSITFSPSALPSRSASPLGYNPDFVLDLPLGWYPIDDLGAGPGPTVPSSPTADFLPDDDLGGGPGPTVPNTPEATSPISTMRLDHDTDDAYDVGTDAEGSSPTPDVHDKLFSDTPLRSRTRALEGLGHTFNLSKALQRVMLVKEAVPWPKPPHMPLDLEARFIEGIKTMNDDNDEEPELDLVETQEQESQGMMEQDNDGASLTDVDSHKARSSYYGHDLDSSTTLATSQSSRPQTSDTNKPFLPIATEMMNKTVWPAKSSVDPQSLTSPETGLQTSQEMKIGKPSTLLHLIGPGWLPKLSSSGPSLAPPPSLQFGAAIPDINITAASPSKDLPVPKRSNHSRKRHTNLADLEAPPVFRPRLAASADTATTGLPVLRPNAEGLWHYHFPGNTPGLLNTILQWSLTMQKMFKRQQKPMYFRLNAAFPYPMSPPTCGSAISLGFYDTQRGEVRFLGPGDARGMYYGELEVFAKPEDDADAASKQAQGNQTLGGALRLGALDKMKERLTPTHKYVDERRRADTGEGRWAFILIKGHADPVSAPAPTAGAVFGPQADTTEPHVMIAWPTSGVTETFSCFHTIYPDGTTPPQQDTSKQGQASPEQKKEPTLRRLSSLQTLQGFLSRSPKQIYQSMRSSSTADLPRTAPLIPDISRPASASASGSRSASLPIPILTSTYTDPSASNISTPHLTVPNMIPAGPHQVPSPSTPLSPPTPQGLTLHRTVLKFEQGGFLPLIEGYRVDVGKFRPWMEAVGRGEGKLIVWRDVRSHGVSRMD